MRRKCTSMDTKAISGNVERNMWVAALVIGFLAFTACVGPHLQPMDHSPMPGCDGGGMCLSSLPYVPGERPTVAIARLEVR